MRKEAKKKQTKNYKRQRLFKSFEREALKYALLEEEILNRKK
jgi:hypothetical protein